MTFDCITYNGEEDLFEIRLNILDKYVDRFIVVEGSETFSGNPKPLYFTEHGKRFDKWKEKIIYQVVGNYYDPEIRKQIDDRSYVDEPAFKRAFYQKETIRKVLETINPNDDDTIIYGDADEIVNVDRLKDLDDKVYKLRQIAYSYYLNNRSPEDWRGTIMTKWKNLKGQCLNDMRANPVNITENGGWHFTNLGGYEAVIKKIESYDHQEVNIDWIKSRVKQKFDDNVDFLGRGFQMWVDDSELPQYIKDNKEKYKHLWKS